MDKKIIRKKHHINSFSLGFLTFLLLACIAIGLALFMWMAASDILALNNDKLEVEVDLPDSIFTVSSDGKTKIADTSYIADLLYDKGLVDYPWLFEAYCNISHAESKFDPGTYELKSSYDYRALIQNMREGTGVLKTVTITIPEGYSMYQIFKKFEEEGVASYDDLMEAAKSGNYKYDFLDGLDDLGSSRLEGFLFPDTYEFYINMDASSAINKMLNNFYQRFNSDLITACENSGYSIHDILKIASYIEREAKFDEDRYKVSAVIRNRLNAQMYLGLDTTILYVHPDHEGEPDAAMLVEESDYNTRNGFHFGLTPTPICNPGMASIQAALNPEPNCYYYYFYADIDTGHLTFFVNDYEFDAYVHQIEEANNNG